MPKGGVVVTAQSILNIASHFLAGCFVGRLICDVTDAIKRRRQHGLNIKRAEEMSDAIRRLFAGGTIYEVGTWDASLPDHEGAKGRN